MWREAASPAAEPLAWIAAPRGGDADSAGQPVERAGAAACGNPLNPVAAEAAEMLVRAARPTASSTFSGYRDHKWRLWADWAIGPCWCCRHFWSGAVPRRARRRRRVPRR